MEFEKYKGSEKELQIALASYLDHLNILWAHNPMGGTRIKREAVSLKKQGAKKGFPDIAIYEPNKDYHGLYIELKVGRNKPSEHQKRWLSRLKQKGNMVMVSYSLSECIDVVNKYLKNV